MARRTPPLAFEVDPGTVLHAFDSTTGLNLSALGGGTAALSSDYSRSDRQVLKCVTASGANLEVRKTVSFSDPSQKFGTWAYVPDYTKLSSLLYYAGAAGFASFKNFTYSFASANAQYNGWHWIDIGVDQWSGGSGTPDWAALGDFKVRVIPQAATVATVYFDEWNYGYRNRPKLLIYADDGYANFVTDTNALPYMTTNNLPANLAVIKAQIDLNSTWATSAQLTQAVTDGHQIIPHGGTSLATLGDYATIYADVKSNQDFVASFDSVGANHYAYPNGAYQISAGDLTIFNSLSDLSIKTGRTTTRQVTYSPRSGAGALMVIPIVGWLSTDTPSSILAQIDTAIKRAHSVALMFHEVVAAGATGTQINSADMKTLLDGIIARRDQGLIDVVKVSDWHEGVVIGGGAPSVSARVDASQRASVSGRATI